MIYPRFIEPERIRPESGAALEEKIEALLRAMTPEEKMNLCHGGTNPVGLHVANAGYLPGVPRLGIPELRMYDGPAGVTSVYETTGLPVQQMLASAWDPELACRYGKVEGSENFAVSGNTQLGSQFDLVRTPHFSRNKDMLGEDPFLTSALAVPETKGIQDQHVIATLKHFAAASIGIDMQNAPDQLIDEQTLHELYFPPFEAAAKLAGAGAFMCSYNKFNGAYASANEYAQKTVLREYWGYKGFMMSDWGSNHSLTIGKGMDMEMPLGAYNGNDRLLRGIERGKITRDDVDNAVRHILYGMGTVGYLALVELDADGNVRAEDGRTEPIAVRDRYCEQVERGLLDENAEICLEVARKGAVLLKNENGALPLTEADYTGENAVAMIGPAAVSLFSGSGQERSYGQIRRMIPPVQALKALCGEDANIAAKVGFDVFGTTIPADCLFADEACTQPGLVRTYGVDDSNITPFLFPGAMGGGGTEFKGTAFADEDDEPIPFSPPWSNDLAADMEGFETGSFCCVDPIINFTCGTIDGRVNQTYKNSADGTAFRKGEAYTWDGWLRVPTDGEYRLILQAIGGNADFKITLDGGEFISIGSTELREGAQWPWGFPVCTPEGMEIRGACVELKAGIAYPIRLCVHASISQKDLQVRLAWIQPEQRMVDYAAALTAAAKAKKVLFFLCEDYSFKPLGSADPFGMMRFDSLKIPAEQLRLLHNIRNVMRPDAQLILIHNNGQLYALGSAEPIADAILNVWTPGQEGGRAIAELLTGSINPSGKLAVTIPQRDCDTLVSDTPEHMASRYTGIARDGRMVVDFDEGIFTGYRWYDREGIRPLYAFGHGLSYTTFAYGDLTAEPDGDGFAVRFTVTNTGSRPGTEIAQVYLGAAQVPTHIQMADKQLCGFARLEDLQPGETREVSIRVPARSLCYWDPNAPLTARADGTKDKWVRTEGSRSIFVGPSSDNLPLQAAIAVS